MDAWGGVGMTGAELILTALVAGAAAGSGDAAKTAVVDAYTWLRDAVRRRLTGRKRAKRILDAVPDNDGSWRAELAADLVESGAADDAVVLEAARRLLEVADPGGTAAGKYRVDARSAGHVHVGDTNIDALGNQGAVGTFHAPVSFGRPPVPPTSPGQG
jgi:hypothetical protein